MTGPILVPVQRRRARAAFMALAVAALALPAAARAGTAGLAGDILRELVPINTAPSGGPGQTRRAAEALAERLRAAGFPAEDVRVLGLAPEDGNLVARLRSPLPARRPILLMAHLDVVEASPWEWDTPPFTLVEKDGYFYGRGTRDVKSGAASLAAVLLRLKAEGFRPDRDLVLFFTADEESTMANTAWLVREQRALVDAEFALNTDGGYVDMEGDRPAAFALQSAEKVYATFELEALGPSGHSRQPVAGNAIYKLAGALRRLEAHRFARDLNEVTREYFRIWAPAAPPDMRAGAEALGAGRVNDPAVDAIETSPYLSAMLRTTCVATQIRGGHGENVLPAQARAVVNCRILPQMPLAEVQRTLEQLASPEGVTVRPVRPVVEAPASPLQPGLMTDIRAVVYGLWPGIPVRPEMSPGATDGLYLRNAGIPTYGVGAVPEDPEDDRSHAANERIRIRAFEESTEFWYRLVKRLASPAGDAAP